MLVEFDQGLADTGPKFGQLWLGAVCRFADGLGESCACDMVDVGRSRAIIGDDFDRHQPNSARSNLGRIQQIRGRVRSTKSSITFRPISTGIGQNSANRGPNMITFAELGRTWPERYQVRGKLSPDVGTRVGGGLRPKLGRPPPNVWRPPPRQRRLPIDVGAKTRPNPSWVDRSARTSSTPDAGGRQHSFGPRPPGVD